MGWFEVVVVSFGGLFDFDSGEGAGTLESLLAVSISSTRKCRTHATLERSQQQIVCFHLT